MKRNPCWRLFFVYHRESKSRETKSCDFNCQNQTETVVRLAPGDDTSPIRTFYLRLEDEEEAQAWAQAIRETRFDHVRGERDALRGAKTCLAEQVHCVVLFCLRCELGIEG